MIIKLKAYYVHTYWRSNDSARQWFWI